MTDETSIETIRALAQQEVDIIVAQSLRSGTDVLVALEGARLMHREALVWGGSHSAGAGEAAMTGGCIIPPAPARRDRRGSLVSTLTQVSRARAMEEWQ